jgi:two-component system sensor histidine kinase DctS
MPPASIQTPDAERRPARARRALLWSALVALLVVAQSLLVLLTLAYEDSRAQDAVDGVAIEAATDIKRDVGRAVQDLQALSWDDDNDPVPWTTRARQQLQVHREVAQIEERGVDLVVREAVASPFEPALFAHLARSELAFEAEPACEAARRASAPAFSRSYFVPVSDGQGQEVIDLCLPRQSQGRIQGYVVATFVLQGMLEAAVPEGQLRSYELSFIEGDGARLVRTGAARGAGIYRAERVVDLPGRSLMLRAESTAGRPSLIPNLTLALVLGLSLALFGVVLMLARDVRRRAQAEQALAESLAFRKAMENSLITGLRARDLQGRITYANPAFCAMVGYSMDELREGQPPPYWPPEDIEEYSRRQAGRLALPPNPHAPSREGFETVFMRRSGERFPVMIYEAPLVDGQGRHTGWMSAVVDVSEQKRVEELSRQQQERLQASARLATMGEMASLLSHELNQPLSAIASYATGSLNLIETADAQTPQLLEQALARIAEQAERAGRVIKSVHDFVRRREPQHEAIAANQLLDAVLPLMRLLARQSGTRIETDLPSPVPRIRCDCTMVEQVLLNLARNGIQAMEDVPLERRVLRVSVSRVSGQRVAISMTDAGLGIGPEVAERLFQPFYTTRREGMGLGLSLCRTVIEQHGGALEFESPWPPHAVGGTRFRFTLPAVVEARARASVDP